MLPELKMMIGIRYLLKQWKNTHLLNTRWMVLLSGSLEDRARLILDCQEEVKSIVTNYCGYWSCTTFRWYIIKSSLHDLDI